MSSFILGLLAISGAFAQIRFTEVTTQVGLGDENGGINAQNVQLTDLDCDGRLDLVLSANRGGAEHEPRRVFLNRPSEQPPGFTFVEVEGHGLPAGFGGALGFVDLNADGRVDCVYLPFLQPRAEGYTPPTETPDGPAILMGNGDGTFGPPLPEPFRIAGVEPKAHHVLAIADLNRDGLLDLYFGASYIDAPDARPYEGFTGDVLLQNPTPAAGSNRVATGTITFRRVSLPEDEGDYDTDPDSVGIATYGGLIASLDGSGTPCIFELGYGRRANRVWTPSDFADLSKPWTNTAPTLGLDGDANHDGRYPEWIRRRAQDDHRFDFTLQDDPPFRTHGNTFDASIADLDNDGDFDLFIAQIRHGWVGDGSDRTGFWMNTPTADGTPHFEYLDSTGNVSRRPTDPDIQSWNEGDLFCGLADFDADGMIDALLASGDYPDNQILRVYRQKPIGTWTDVTPWSGLGHHDGCHQVSLGDLDLDGDLDIVAGQAFMRYDAAQRDGRAGPAVACFVNQSTAHSLLISIKGDVSRGVNIHGIGAIVRVTAIIDGKEVTQARQLMSVAGRGGKQDELCVHFGLGDAEKAERVEITLPDAAATKIELRDVPAGRHEITLPIGDDR